MFTGLIEKLGIVKEIKKIVNGTRLIVNIPNSAKNNPNEIYEIGESISVNGICLSVEKIIKDNFEFFISAETFEKTTVKNWENGKYVNIERALEAGKRLGGHFVTGHIDGVGTFKNRKKIGETEIFSFSFPDSLSNFIVEKGSIAVDGISLTAFDIKQNEFSVAIIPLTLKATNLQYLRLGEQVNLETDLIGKYIFKHLNNYFSPNGEKKSSDHFKHSESRITEDFLKKHGF